MLQKRPDLKNICENNFISKSGAEKYYTSYIVEIPCRIFPRILAGIQVAILDYYCFLNFFSRANVESQTIINGQRKLNLQFEFL